MENEINVWWWTEYCPMITILTFFSFLYFLDPDLATDDCLEAADNTDPGPDMFQENS